MSRNRCPKCKALLYVHSRLTVNNWTKPSRNKGRPKNKGGVKSKVNKPEMFKMFKAGVSTVALAERYDVSDCYIRDLIKERNK